MDINSLQGASAYTNAPNITPPVDNTRLQEQNQEASRTDLNQEAVTAAQQAFRVTLTQEAQNLLAQEATPPESTQTAPPPPPETEIQTPPNQAAAAQARQVVNIVA